MSLNPISTSDIIIENYVKYIETTFYINDADYMNGFKDLISKNFFRKGPFVEISNSYEIGKSLDELICDNVLSDEFRELFKNQSSILQRKLYKHQEEAIVSIANDNNTIITTGTGSGKTESFLFPIFNHILDDAKSNKLTDGIRAIIIYPMNALANDQMKRLRELLCDYPKISFALYTGETENEDNKALDRYLSVNKSKPLPNERISRNQIKLKPPHILITNYAMLEYLMLRPDDNILFFSDSAKNWKYIILDEAHTYKGANGIEVSMLLRRLINLLSNKNNCRFILTSATLGDIDKNDDICSFGSQLCAGYEFQSKNIIRATKVNLKRKDILNETNPDYYTKLNDLIESNVSIEEIYSVIHSINKKIQKTDTKNELLYEYVLNEKLYYDLTDLLQNKPLTISELADKLGIDCNTITCFINIAIKAYKNHIHLLKARYHLFVRSLEGAYITIGQEKHISITPQKTKIINNEEFKWFKINVCQYCGQIYFEGKIKDSFFVDDKSDNKYYYLLSNLDNDKNEDIDSNTEEDFDENTFNLCGKCGRIQNDKLVNSCMCSCDNKNYVKVKEIDIKDKTTLHRCNSCGSINTRNSVLRSFHLGQEAVSSVLLSSLYEELPNKNNVNQSKIKPVKSSFFTNSKITNQKEVNNRQILAFSDSRQESAYFASYFDFTYNNIIRKRLVVYTLRQLQDNCKTYDININKFVEHLAQNFVVFGITNEGEELTEAWKTVLYEMTTRDRNSLENLGLLSFEYIPKEIEINNISKEDFKTLQIILANSFKKLGIISLPNDVSLTKKDKEYYLYKSFEIKMKIEKKGDKRPYVSYWVPIKNNSRVDFLMRSLNLDYENSKNFLRDYWEHVLLDEKTTSLKEVANNEFLMKLSSFKIISNLNNTKPLFKCNKCGNMTFYNLNNTCLTYKCQGELQEQTFEELNSFNHYRNQFLSPKIFPMKIKEHTAQLSPDLAKKYQELFLKKEINILSCSTTFELGVDVGDLEAVFLKNIPPSPPNYVQRAGRAGRRTDSTAFSLTLCRLSSHDLTFYKNPLKMITGEMYPPKFTIENQKIIKRHINAIILASFWKNNPMLFKDVSTFFENNNYNLLKYFISNLPEETTNYIKSVCPSKSHNIIEEWIKDLYSDEGRLNYCFLNYKYEIDELINLMDNVLDKWNVYKSISPNDCKNSEKLTLYKNKLENEKILSFLSRKNILPKYGFPIDTVELETSISNGFHNNNLRLQRDLTIAISEYAPDSEVIADGYIYKSRYIKLPKGTDKIWSQYDYGICNNDKCNNIKVIPFYGEDKENFGNCEICGDPVSKKNTFVTPDYGFFVDNNVEKATTKKPKKTYRGDIYYLGKSQELIKESLKLFNFKNLIVSIKSTSDDELVVINESHFFVCSQCGYSELQNVNYSSFIKHPHANHYGYSCNNMILERRTLGHKYKTDVTSLCINRYLERNISLSVLYTLLEGISLTLDIERTDISGCVSYNKSTNNLWETSFIIYDTVPGGAGHVRRIGQLNEQGLRELFKNSLEIVLNCNCGSDGNDNSACYSCICNYQNQKYHNILNRRLAIDFFEEILED